MTSPTIKTKLRKTPGVSVRMMQLPSTFQPTPSDVLCGRGGVCKHWPGNLRYRQKVASALSEYASASSKHAKSTILDRIVVQVRSEATSVGGAGFCKQEGDMWYEVGDFLAREKTSQCFRDALSDQYTSSAHAKYKRRQEVKGASPQQQQRKRKASVVMEEKEVRANVYYTRLRKLVISC